MRIEVNNDRVSCPALNWQKISIRECTGSNVVLNDKCTHFQGTEQLPGKEFILCHHQTPTGGHAKTTKRPIKYGGKKVGPHVDTCPNIEHGPACTVVTCVACWHFVSYDWTAVFCAFPKKGR